MIIFPLYSDKNQDQIGSAYVTRTEDGSDFDVVVELNDPLMVNDPENANLARDLKLAAEAHELKVREQELARNKNEFAEACSEARRFGDRVRKLWSSLSQE